MTSCVAPMDATICDERENYAFVLWLTESVE